MRTDSIEIMLADLERQRFFGSIELKYEGGQIVLIRRTETIKPGGQDCRDNRGENYGGTQRSTE